MKNLSVNNILITAYVLLIGTLSLTSSILIQQIPIKIALISVLILISGVIGLSLVKLSVKTFLIFYSILLIYPKFEILIPLSFVVITIAMVEVFRNNDATLKIPQPLWFLLLFITGTLAYIKGMNYDLSLYYYCTTILIPFIVVFSVYNSNLNIESIKKIMYINLVISSIVGFLGIIIALANPTSRTGSTWITAMTINGYYLINFFCGLGFLLTEKRKNMRILILFMLFLIFLGMLFTYTRMALLAVFFGFGLVILRYKQYRKYIIMVLLIIPFIIPESMTNRVDQGIQGDVSTIVRLLCWYNSVKLIAGNFFFGIGIRTFATVSKTMIPVDFLYAPHSHNIYLHLLLETGIFGFLAYFFIIFLNIYKFFRNFVLQNDDSFMYMFFVSMLSIMFAGLTDIFIVQLTLSTFFWMYFGFIVKLIKIKEDDKSNKFYCVESC